MSDTGRKNLSDSVSDTLTPDSQKSGMDQAKDQASGAYDKVAGAVQPESQKSTSQKASDTVSSGKGDAESEGSGMLNKVSDALGMGGKK